MKIQNRSKWYKWFVSISWGSWKIQLHGWSNERFRPEGMLKFQHAKRIKGCSPQHQQDPSWTCIDVKWQIVCQDDAGAVAWAASGGRSFGPAYASVCKWLSMVKCMVSIGCLIIRLQGESVIANDAIYYIIIQCQCHRKMGHHDQWSPGGHVAAALWHMQTHLHLKELISQYPTRRSIPALAETVLDLSTFTNVVDVCYPETLLVFVGWCGCPVRLHRRQPLWSQKHAQPRKSWAPPPSSLSGRRTGRQGPWQWMVQDKTQDKTCSLGRWQRLWTGMPVISVYFSRQKKRMFSRHV